jgi:hypothetical protein
MHKADMGQVFSTGVKGDDFEFGSFVLGVNGGETKTQDKKDG